MSNFAFLPGRSGLYSQPLLPRQHQTLRRLRFPFYLFMVTLLLGACQVSTPPVQSLTDTPVTAPSPTPLMTLTTAPTLTQVAQQPEPTQAIQVSPTVSEPLAPGNSPMILYVTGNCTVKAIGVDGGEPITLTTNPPSYDCWRPKFSPDGEKLAFILGDGAYDFYVMNLDGSGLVKVANAMAYAWSPDSTRLVYHTFDEGTGLGSLMLVQADGSNPQPLGYTDVSICTQCSGDLDLSWSPDGQWIYAPTDVGFPDDGRITAGLYKVDGSEYRSLFDTEIFFFPAAAWSTDSRWLALPMPDINQGVCNAMQIFSPETVEQAIPGVMAYKAGEPGMAPSCFMIVSPVWSPDGKSLATAGYPQGNYPSQEISYARILVFSPTGENANLLEYWPGIPGAFLWSPDSSQLVFTATSSFNGPEGSDGSLVIMNNDPENPAYIILADEVKNSPGALFWMNP